MVGRETEFGGEKIKSAPIERYAGAPRCIQGSVSHPRAASRSLSLSVSRNFLLPEFRPTFRPLPFLFSHDFADPTLARSLARARQVLSPSPQNQPANLHVRRIPNESSVGTEILASGPPTNPLSPERVEFRFSRTKVPRNAAIARYQARDE